MKLLLLDTSIILYYLRNGVVRQLIDDVFAPFENQNMPFVSVISVGEIKSLGLRNKWGKVRLREMDLFFRKVIVLDINRAEILQRYAEIDAFSQGRLNNRKSNFSARNMGKNDVWIAATASVLEAVLLTTDNDFDHLHDEFLSVAKIDLTN